MSWRDMEPKIMKEKLQFDILGNLLIVVLLRKIEPALVPVLEVEKS